MPDPLPPTENIMPPTQEGVAAGGVAPPDEPSQDGLSITPPLDEPAELSPPPGWDADAQTRFRSLPRADQQWLLDRAAAQDAQVRRIQSETAPLQGALQQWTGYARQLGVTPEVLFNQAMSMESLLRAGTPAQKQQALATLAHQYGIPYQLPQPAAPQLPTDAAGRPDPTALAVHQALGPLQQQIEAVGQQYTAMQQALAQQQQAQQQRQVDAWATEIERFASARDQAGQPAHPHFQEVIPEMTAFAQAEIAAGGLRSSLADLYERATWASPTVRPKLLAAGRQETRQRQRAGVQQARQAGTMLGGGTGGTPPAGTTPARTLREQIEAAYTES